MLSARDRLLSRRPSSRLLCNGFEVLERNFYLDQRSRGSTIAIPTIPRPALSAKTIPTGICTDSNAKNLSATGVAF